MKCNWKAVPGSLHGGFPRHHHHPQMLAASATRTRNTTPGATCPGPSPQTRPRARTSSWDPREQDLLEAVTMRDLDDRRMPDCPRALRAARPMAAGCAVLPRSCVGDDTVLSDAELSTASTTPSFQTSTPGAAPTASCTVSALAGPHDRSLMECYYLSPFKGERPDPAPLHLLGEDDPWTDAPELGMLAGCSRRTPSTCRRCNGVWSRRSSTRWCSPTTRKRKLRHFHDLLSEWVSR